jgi:hypothetical protein
MRSAVSPATQAVHNRKATALQFAHMKISVWNIAAVTLMAVIGILVLKVLFSRVNVPGLSDAVRAV